jgi:hypothetical protein
MEIVITSAADCLRHIRGSICEHDYEQALAYIDMLVSQQQRDLVAHAWEIAVGQYNAPLSAEL